MLKLISQPLLDALSKTDLVFLSTNHLKRKNENEVKYFELIVCNLNLSLFMCVEIWFF